MLIYFKGSFISIIIGFILALFVGYYYSGTMSGALQALFITAVLAVLEVSLSFDNAIVNAIVLKEMTPVWRHRFLTWGMAIAVFGMRLVFPLAIVSVVGKINPWSALMMATFKPDQYAHLMESAHLGVSAFGGMFLLMVSLRYFYDEAKNVHWIAVVERPFAQLGKIDEIEIGLALLTMWILSSFLPEGDQLVFLLAGIAGLFTFIAVDGIGAWLEMSQEGIKDMHKASAGMFIYLEVLDASFSFDGVVGAFAITHNLFIIMIGLSVGAFFVRSLTIMFVEKEVLKKFLYLEHGAFYAIGFLALIMLLDPFLHVPEWVTGLLGGFVILTAFYWSIRCARLESSQAPRQQ
ncbi:MAG: DUF475 domain-containing protein [Bdellovibrionaceae bacterium]|nr:DUF475 domain-containing protein [Pseudobdellovibrionaceae bacterium]